MKWNHLLFFILLIVFFTENLFGQGCSQCKMVAEQGSELDDSAFTSNINIGILYLMIIPYLLIMFLFRHKLIAFFKAKFSKDKGL